jgi:hypothetical protein
MLYLDASKKNRISTGCPIKQNFLILRSEYIEKDFGFDDDMMSKLNINNLDILNVRFRKP